MLFRSVASAATNLAPNGNFEQAGTNSPVASWTVAGDGAIALDTGTKFAGKSALKVSLEKAGTVRAESARFEVTPNALYLLSGWVRTEGFGPGSYEGVDASLSVQFISKAGAGLPTTFPLIPYPYTVGLPYGDVTNWQLFYRLTTAPADAAQAQISVNINSTKDHASICRLDNLTLAVYNPPKAEGQAWVYEVATKMALQSAEAVDDPDAGNGKAAKATKGVHKKGCIVYGPYTKDQAAGQYRVTVRAKVEDNTSAEPVFAVRLVADGSLGDMANTLFVRGTDFKAANKYQDFEFEAIKPATGTFQFPVDWSGATSLWLDRITVTTEHVLTPLEIQTFWP